MKKRKRSAVAVDEELLKILACPKCKKKVYLDQSGEFVNCDRCRLQYPLENDIPVMLIERARKMD